MRGQAEQPLHLKRILVSKRECLERNIIAAQVDARDSKSSFDAVQAPVDVQKQAARGCFLQLTLETTNVGVRQLEITDEDCPVRPLSDVQ